MSMRKTSLLILLLFKSASVVAGLFLSLLTVFRDLFASGVSETHDHPMQDSDMIGDFNHRTGRLDAGNDPFGWYDED